MQNKIDNSWWFLLILFYIFNVFFPLLIAPLPYVFYLDLNMYGNKFNFKAYYIILNLLCIRKMAIFIYWVKVSYHD